MVVLGYKEFQSLSLCLMLKTLLCSYVSHESLQLLSHPVLYVYANELQQNHGEINHLHNL